MKNDESVQKQIQETKKESEIMNNKNTYAYIQAEMNVMLTQMQAKKAIKFFGKMYIAEVINELKQLNEGVMPVNPVVITLNPDEFTYE